MTTTSRVSSVRFRRGLFILLAAGAVAGSAAAQATLTLSGGSGAPGASVTVGVNLVTNGTQPAAVQFDLLYAPGDLSPASGTFWSTGSSASNAGKSVSCSNPSSGDVRCIVAGFNTTAITDGSLASVTFVISSTTSNTLSAISSSASASDGSGTGIPISGGGTSITINQPVTVSLTNLSCSPGSVTPPTGFSCTITLSGNAPSNTNVTVSSNSGNAIVASPVTVNSGSSTANFNVTTTAVSSSTTATITASLNGTNKTSSVTLLPPVPTLTNLNCSPGSVTPPTGFSCTITLSGNAPSNTNVTVSSNSANAVVTSPVTVNSGSSTANFNATTTAVSSSTLVTITATLNGTSQTSSVTLLPPVPTLTNLSCSPGSVTPPTGFSCTITLSGNAPSNTNVTVSSNSGNAVVTSPVTVNSGSSTANFNVTTTAVSSSTTATITASLNGTNKTSSVTLLPPVPTLTNLNCSPGSVTPPTGFSCTITLSGNAPSNTNVTVSSNSANAVVTSPVTVNSGSSTANFNATTTAVSSSTLVTITATLNGTSQTSSVTLLPPVPTLTNLSCSPGSVTPPTGFSCTITLSGNAPSNTNVTVSSNSGNAIVASPVTVNSGSSTANFNVTTTAVSSSTTATITASLNGTNKTSSVTLLPPVPTLTNLSCSPGSVTPPTGFSCTITLSGNAPSNTNVTVSSNSGNAIVASPVTVNSGSSTANFNVTTTAVSSSTTATITASLNGTNKTSSVTLLPPVPTLTNLSCSPGSVTPPTGFSCTITLSGNAPSNTNVTVSSNSGNAIVASPVTVNSGSSTANFNVTTTAVSSSTTATITASLNGTNKTSSVTLLPPVPTLTNLSCSPGSVTPPTGFSCTITLSGNAPSNTNVTVSSNSGNAIVASPVTVNSGSSTANFNVTTTAVSSSTLVTITASLSGTSQTSSVTLLPPVPVLSNLTCTPASFTAPGSSTCTITLTGNALSNMSVTVSSNNGAATVVSPVTIPTGSSSANFTVTAGSAVQSSTTAGITASLNGNSRNFSINLTPQGVTQPGVQSVICVPSTVSGGSSTTCTVTLASAAPSGGTPVSLASSNGNATVQSQLTVPAGLDNANFTVTTAAVASVQSATISATSTGPSRSATLTIQPAVTLSSMSCSPGTIAPGAATACTVFLNAVAPSGGVTVGLSSGSSAVSVPNSVSVPAGVISAAFQATGVSGGSSILTASYAGSSVNFSVAVTGQSSLASVSCSPLTVNAGSASSCSVSLSGPAGQSGANVSLSSSNAQVTVPSSVSVPPGASSAGFSAAVSANASGSATITASMGANVRTTNLSITAASNSPSLVCSPSTIHTPGSTTCTFSLGSAAQSPTAVSLNSSSATVSVPAVITIGTGLTSATFTATASAVSATSSVVISAPNQGVSQSLTLLGQSNSNLAVTSVSCNPLTLIGGGTSACQITLSGAASANSPTISLSSSSTQLTVPPVLQTVPGSATVSFNATSALIDHDDNANLIANLGSSSAQATISLLGLKPTAITCPQTLQSGLPLSCQITMNSGAATTSVPIAISGGGQLVTFPATVSTVSGQSTVSFQGNTNYVNSNQTITVSGSYHGTGVQATVTLTPAPPVLTVPGSQTVAPGHSVAFTVSATDPVGLTVTLSATNLPPDSSFNPNTGAFNWSPQNSQMGQYAVTFTATNSAQASSTADVTIEVKSDSPVISALANAASF